MHKYFLPKNKESGKTKKFEANKRKPKANKRNHMNLKHFYAFSSRGGFG